MVGRWRGLIRLIRFHPQTEADNVGSPPGWSATSRGGRPRGWSGPFIILRQRIDGRVSEAGHDAHGDPLPRASASPKGPGQIVALVGAGVDQMGGAVLDGPSWAEVGTTIVILLTRV